MQPQKQDNSIKRISRPLGLTLLAQQVNNKQIDNSTIEKILSYMLNNKIQINNKEFSINTLATYLNIPSYRIMKAYINYQNKLSGVILGDKESLKGALIFSILEKNLEDRQGIAEQLYLLRRSQSGRYKPFISTAVNEALDLSLKSTKSFLDLYRVMAPNPNQSTTNILNNLQPETATKSISISEALILLEKEGLAQISYDENRYPNIKAQNLLDNAPEVRANFQSSERSDAISLVKSKSTTEDLGHPNRRGVDENLDLENHI